MGGGGEAGADGDQQYCGGPDHDAWHRGQDLRKRVLLQQGVDLGFQGPALFVNQGKGAGRGGDDCVEGAGSGDHDGLFVEGVEDVVDEPGGHARGLGPDQLDQSAASGFPQGGRGAVAFEQPGHRRMVQAWVEGAFQGWGGTG